MRYLHVYLRILEAYGNGPNIAIPSETVEAVMSCGASSSLQISKTKQRKKIGENGSFYKFRRNYKHINEVTLLDNRLESHF